MSRRELDMFVITDTCIACGSCVDSCATEAIVLDDSVNHYVISQDKCIQCGSCVDTCPLGAIEEQ